MSTNAPVLRNSALVGATLATALLAWTPPLEARVTRIVIDAIDPVAGQPYEQLTGRAFGELDPSDPKNALITDIELAAGSSGKATYIASWRIRKPIDMRTSSGLMWHDVPNRGGNVNLTPDLFAAGDMQLLSGWQGENAQATRLPPNVDCLPPYVAPCAAPVFTNHYVKTPVLAGVTGRIVGRIINRSGLGAQPLNVMGNPIPYFPADVNSNSGDTLTTILHETINGVVTVGDTVPNSDWKYCGGGTFDAPTPVTVLPVRLCLKDGFDPAKLYQLVYTVTDPYVLGAGTAAFRDVQSFFRYQAQDDFGTANPIYGRVSGPSSAARRNRAISPGTSSTSA